jgi:5-methylcytosine-specific restriction endonuclease McrA
MAASETKTADKKERDRDKRLRKTYGITLDQYNQILDAQDGKCAICGRPATDFKTSLNVDHFHFKITAIKINDGWIAATKFPDGRTFQQMKKTKKDAIAAVRELALRHSVRGLLCPGRHGKAGNGCCNRLLGRVDNIHWLLQSVHYLENPPAKIVLDKTPTI